MSSEPETEFDPDRVVIRDNRKIDRDAKATADGEQPLSAAAAAAEPAEAGREDDVPKADALLLEERTRDVQRLQAEYANYRKRADRERLVAGDIAIGRTLAELLPVVDDLDRAKAHGDLTGALKSVADKLEDTFSKLGLQAFGAVGDPFDPSIHEAVMHDESDAVAVPTCTTVLRKGYQHHDRLLRPAMVGVTDPVALRPADQPAGTGDAGPHGEQLEDAVKSATTNATEGPPRDDPPLEPDEE